MKPLFVSYIGTRGGQTAAGWIVLDHELIRTSMDVNNLAVLIEDTRRYDPGTLIVQNFRRLED